MIAAVVQEQSNMNVEGQDKTQQILKLCKISWCALSSMDKILTCHGKPETAMPLKT